MYTVMGGTLLNLGITLSAQGNQAVASGSFVGAGELSFGGISLSLKFISYLDRSVKCRSFHDASSSMYAKG